MSQENLEAKLKQQLKRDRVQLWNPPYTGADEQPGLQHMQELAERYAPLLRLPAAALAGALEAVRLQALRRGRGNATFRETQVATLELLLPRGCKEEPKTKQHLETKLDVLAQEVVDRIREQFALGPVKLIVNGRTLNVDQRLDQQGVKNHGKLMVLKVSDGEEEVKKNQEEEKKKKSQEESIQRTHKAFNILSNRDGSEDPDTVPFLEIADQKGNPLKIPDSEKKALILAMGFHETGRSLMKKKQFDDALCHLLQADQQFSQCGSALLSSVDNFAVLQLDVVWCYQALEALGCLQDGRARLQRAEDAFHQCYGERRQRLLRIQGNSGREDVLFLRLHLLQSLLSYIEGDDAQARLQLDQVDVLYSQLVPDLAQMSQLMSLGFSETEARLGLRACQGDIQRAAELISTQREEREEQRKRERSRRSSNRRRRRREEVLSSSLQQLGFSPSEASEAAQLAQADLDRACGILLDSQGNSQQLEAVSPEKLQQLTYLGFQRDEAHAALRLAAGDVQAAAQLLLDHQGALAADPATSSSSPSPSSEEPSTSSDSAEDRELVREVLEELPQHEEDYLDLTLEEESQLIATMRNYLGGGGGSGGGRGGAGGGAAHSQ